jgi:hypothetical protein
MSGVIQEPDEPRRGLELKIRLLPEPSLWCWEIRDPVRGELIESSWEDEWVAYETPEEAWAAGLRRMRLRRAA